jgi:hypothetical protein
MIPRDLIPPGVDAQLASSSAIADATCGECGLMHPGPHPTHDHVQPAIHLPCPTCRKVSRLRLQLGPSPDRDEITLAAVGLLDTPPQLRAHAPGVYFAPVHSGNIPRN